MILLQAPNFKDFFKHSVVFTEICKKLLKEVQKDKEEVVVDEIKCKMVAQICAETIIKHNMNAAQMGRCDLPMFIDKNNSKEVRKYFALFKKDARKDVNARALQLQTNWLQSVFCLIISREIDCNRSISDELKSEFLKYATN